MPAHSKFTAAVREKILEVKRAGGPDTLACQWAGISVESLRLWKNKGRQADEGNYHDFVLAIEEAEATPQVRALFLLQKKLPDNDNLLMKYIERQVKGYEPPAMVPPQVHIGPTVIALTFSDGRPATPDWLHTEVIDAPQSPALSDGGGSPDTDQAADS